MIAPADARITVARKRRMNERLSDPRHPQSPLELTYSSRIGRRTHHAGAWRLATRMFKHQLAGLE
jgi:hypothetical protein